MRAKISAQSLQTLCDLITAKPYRTGSDLIAFFNQFGWSDEYGQGFPSRWKYAEEKLNSLNSDGRIVEAIEQATDPRNFLGTDEDIEQIVQDLNEYLQYDNLQLHKLGLAYKVKRLAGARFGEEIKNIIFASTGPKPDIVIQDALTNKINIIRNSEFCLVYDREISEDGLFWHDIVDWWSDQLDQPIDLELERNLYTRLVAAIPESSPPAKLLFETYYRFRQNRSNNLPALLPEVYLHFDPKTLKERGGFEVLKRQRMDFLLLLPNGIRIVIEVDGKQHYSTGEIANPQLYSDLMNSDRELQLLGYEVYRFGGYELQGQNAKRLVERFFTKLLERYLKNIS